MATINKYNLSVKGIPLLGVLGETADNRDTNFSRKAEYFKAIWNVSDVKWLGSINSKGIGPSSIHYDVIGYPLVPYDEVKSKMTTPLVGVRIGGKIYVNLGKDAFEDNFYVNKLLNLFVVNDVIWYKRGGYGECTTTVQYEMAWNSNPTPHDFNIFLTLADTAKIGDQYGSSVRTKIPAGTSLIGTKTAISFHIDRLDVDTGENTCVLNLARFYSNGGFSNQGTYYDGLTSASWSTALQTDVIVDTADVKRVRYLTKYTLDPMTLV